MLAIRNMTPFAAGLNPALDKEGRGFALLVVKATFVLVAGKNGLCLAEEQQPICFSDEHHGDPATSSLRTGDDLALRKAGTDVVLLGMARPRSGRVKALDVTLQVGSAIKKTVRAIGDRKWEKSLGSWRWTDPQPYEEMPLEYERAFGGKDPAASKDGPALHEKRNPVGRGFIPKGSKADPAGVSPPNLEHPAQPIRGPWDTPDPIGFGPIARSWTPRIARAGTYDEAWQKGRCPLLPLDFDDRFFNAAPDDQVTPVPLSGGEMIRLVNAAPLPEISLEIPKRRLVSKWQFKGSSITTPLTLDTLVLDFVTKPCVMLTWRTALPCGQDFLYVDHVRVSEEG